MAHASCHALLLLLAVVRWAGAVAGPLVMGETVVPFDTRFSFCLAAWQSDFTSSELQTQHPASWYVHYGNGICDIGNTVGTMGCAKICASVDGSRFFSVSETTPCHTCDSPYNKEFVGLYHIYEVLQPSTTVSITTAVPNPNFKQCKSQATFNIRMCRSHMCTGCRLAWCMQSCQEVQEEQAGCRCEGWPASRLSYSGEGMSGSGKYGDSGDYSKGTGGEPSLS